MDEHPLVAPVLHELALALAGVIEARDGGTGNHCGGISSLTADLAAAMGLAAWRVETVRIGAALHDIGKVGVPDAVLRKPGPLDDKEWAIMRRHPLIGADILRGIEALRALLPVITYHHERWDGIGYPAALSGEDLPMEARIVAVVDAFAAMTEDRPYRKGLSRQKTLREIRRGDGAQFDPAVVRVFVGLFRGEEEVVTHAGGGRNENSASGVVAGTHGA